MFDNTDFYLDIYQEKNESELKEFNDEYDDEFWEYDEEDAVLDGWE